jgi:hypothetical protein
VQWEVQSKYFRERFQFEKSYSLQFPEHCPLLADCFAVVGTPKPQAISALHASRGYEWLVPRRSQKMSSRRSSQEQEKAEDDQDG